MKLRNRRRHVNMDNHEEMGVCAPLDPLVVKRGCQFGYFSIPSFQHYFERSEFRPHKQKRLNEGIQFVLIVRNEEFMTLIFTSVRYINLLIHITPKLGGNQITKPLTHW